MESNLHFPDCLKQYRDILKPYEKYIIDYIVIHSKEVKRHTAILKSKLLGLPYLPLGVEYPRDKDGQLMRLLIQINFAEAPHIEYIPEQGILQVFISWRKHRSGDMEYCKIIYHEQVGEYQTNFDFLPDSKSYSQFPVREEKRLSFFRKLKYDEAVDCDFRTTYYKNRQFETVQSRHRTYCHTVRDNTDCRGSHHRNQEFRERHCVDIFSFSSPHHCVGQGYRWDRSTKHVPRNRFDAFSY
jgi:uncharacterized protein YwqG